MTNAGWQWWRVGRLAGLAVEVGLAKMQLGVVGVDAVEVGE